MNKGLTNSVVENPYVARIEELTQELSRLQSERDEAQKDARFWSGRHTYVTAELAEEKAARERLQAELDHTKQVEFPKRVQNVAQGWREKCTSLESLVASLRAQLEEREKALRLAEHWFPSIDDTGITQAAIHAMREAARALLGEKQNG